MAKVLLQPIGRARESFLAEADFEANREAMDKAASPVLEGRDTVRSGWATSTSSECTRRASSPPGSASSA
jgi:hypothetical protein